MHAIEIPDSAEPMQLSSVVLAPLCGVVLALAAVWISAIPRPMHEVAYLILCTLRPSDCIPPPLHIVRIDQAGLVSWDGVPQAGRTAVEARLKVIGAMPPRDQPDVHVMPAQATDYGALMAVLAAAQRLGVQNVSVGLGDREILTFTPPSELRPE